MVLMYAVYKVSTHSRLKAAGSKGCERNGEFTLVSTHSRLKAAGRLFAAALVRHIVSTHSRLKAAGTGTVRQMNDPGSFNTQPPEGGWHLPYLFAQSWSVSTHSRLKAAGPCITLYSIIY